MMRILLGIVLIASFSAAYAGPFAVQIGAVGTVAEAQAQASAARTAGLSGVFVEAGGTWQRVEVGPLEYYIEALLVRDDLRATGYPDAFIRDLKDSSPETLLSYEGNRDAVSVMKPFFRSNEATASEMTVQSLKDNTIYEQLEMLDRSGDKDAYEMALLETLPRVANDDPLNGYVYTNLGICEIRRKNYDKALTYLEPVANGEVPSAAAHRVMAMYRVAWITHWHKGDRLAAYRAYRQLEAFSGSPALKAKCRVECVGLMMELAESGKGTHDEVRAAVSEALELIPESEIKQRAVVELMNTETYARQANPDPLRSARLSEEFITKYAGNKELERELATATYQTGLFYQEAGDKEKARLWYDRVLRDVPPNVDHFAEVHPYAQALRGNAMLAREEGNTVEEKQIWRDIVELYPDDVTSKMILKNFPNIREDVEPSASLAPLREETK